MQDDQTSSPNHSRSNGFVERMVGVAKKLMDKAGKEGKPWISGLFDYRVTPVRQYCITTAITDSTHPGKRIYLNFPVLKGKHKTK